MTARITPYEIVLGPLESTAFPEIRAEAERRGTDVRRRDQFLLLAAVGATLKDMVPEDAPAEAIDEYGELLYEGYQFWEYGHRLYVLSEEVTSLLTQPVFDVGAWQLAAPPSCYVQFPYQRLWARVSAEAPYEPVDGCFVVVDDTQPAPQGGAHLRVQLVMGFRANRPGLSLVSYRTDLDPRDAAEHANVPWREEGAAFANAIPGGERKDYRSLATTSELEALVLRTLFYLDTNSTALSAVEGSAEEGATRLAHVRVGQ